MVGYVEALTDPSYFGQILVFAYPLIGNYGVPADGFESRRIYAAGTIVFSESKEAYHWRSVQTLDAWLRSQNVPGLTGVDTRHLVSEIRRSRSGLLAAIEPEGMRVQEFFDPSAADILPFVSVKSPESHGTGRLRIGLIDCGVKTSIIRKLVALGCRVDVLPWSTDFSSVRVDGWVVSNGPGDPTRTGDLVDRIRRLTQGNVPILGICLGHQLLALASGAKTEKMSYGHRSQNQPVQLVGTRRGFLTSQNHGYVILPTTLSPDWEPWFLNANDQSIEGIRHKSKPFRSVQFHPEAAAGPRDTEWIFSDFVQEVKQCQS